jgi:tetratricopeptide (TPR) repeat protein
MTAFVGRTAELARLRAWAEETAATGTGRLVLVTGEAGAGKTRLCGELDRSLPEAGFAVAWSRCWGGGCEPILWPWPDLVGELASQRQLRLGHLDDRARDRFAAYRAVVDQLREICATGPAVALVDDLHAAGHDAVLLTRFVARSLHRFPLLLVATWGSEREPPADRAARLDFLAGDATVLDLAPFGADEVSAYLRTTGHSDPTPDEVSRLLAACGGNPMYLAELVHQAADGDTGLAQILSRRVGRFGEPLRSVLRAAALLGDRATVDEVARLLACSAAVVVDALDDPASGATVASGRVQFAHELIREVIVAALPAAERQRLHVAATRAIRGTGAEHAVRRAQHAVEAAPVSAELHAAAVTACATAAAALQRALAYEQAVEWAARGAALAAGVSPASVEAELLLAHAGAVLACGRLAEARDLYRQAVAPAERAGDPRLLAHAALGLGGVWVEEQRDEVSRRRMLGLCRRALAALPPDEPLLAARLRVRLAAEQAYDGASVDEMGLAVDRVRRLGDPAATAEALSLYHHSLLLPNRASARLAVADELLDNAAQADGTVYGLFGLCWRAVDLYLLGDGRAERAFVDLRERATALSSRSIGYIAAVLDVMRTFRQGELERAEAQAGEVLTLGLAVGDADALAYYGAHLLAIRWVQGRLGEMTETITSVVESSTLRRRDQIYPATLAYAHALRGDHGAARSAVDALLADGLDGIPDFPTWTATVAALIETAAEIGDGRLASELGERFAPYAHLPVMPSLAVICLGPGERVLAVAHAAAGRLDEAVKWFQAALEANRRLRSRPFDPLIRAQLAAVLGRRRASGDREAAAALYAAAIELGRELGLSARVPGWEEDAAALDGAPAPVRPLRGVLERRPDSWYVEIDGRSATVDSLVGMRHVAELLARPDTDIAATALSAALTGGAGAALTSRGAPALDDQALRDYRRRIDELDRELDAADLRGDAERARRAADERGAVVEALRRDTGLGGRPRRLSDDSERCRMRVSKAIHRAIARVDEVDPVLGRALATGIHTGYVCRYVTDPGRPIAWTVRVRPERQSA